MLLTSYDSNNSETMNKEMSTLDAGSKFCTLFERRSAP